MTRAERMKQKDELKKIATETAKAQLAEETQPLPKTEPEKPVKQEPEKKEPAKQEPAKKAEKPAANSGVPQWVEDTMRQLAEGQVQLQKQVVEDHQIITDHEVRISDLETLLGYEPMPPSVKNPLRGLTAKSKKPKDKPESKPEEPEPAPASEPVPESVEAEVIEPDFEPETGFEDEADFGKSVHVSQDAYGTYFRVSKPGKFRLTINVIDS